MACAGCFISLGPPSGWISTLGPSRGSCWVELAGQDVLGPPPWVVPGGSTAESWCGHDSEMARPCARLPPLPWGCAEPFQFVVKLEGDYPCP